MSRTRPLAVCFVSDEAYAAPLAAAVESVVSNIDPRRNCRIYVLDLGLSEQSRERLRTIGTKRTGIASTEFIQIDRRSLPAECARPSLASAFAKLQIADVLPTHCTRAVLLDADLIVRDDLGLLYDADLQGQPLGACRHCWLTNGHAGLERSGHQRSPYFNSGVMVVDLEQWRAEQIGSKAQALASSDGFMFNDQDALNVLLESRWQPLAHRWNVLYLQMDPEQVRRELRDMSPDVFTDADLDSMEKAPGVVHFGIPISTGPSVLLSAGTTFSKPWSYWSTHPERERFFEHLDRTPWCGFRESAATVVDMAADEVLEATFGQGADYGTELADALVAPSFVERIQAAQDHSPPGLNAAIRFFVARRDGADPRRMGTTLSEVVEGSGDRGLEAGLDYLARFCAVVRRARPNFEVADFAVDLATRIRK